MTAPVSLDASTIADMALRQAARLLSEWFPGGKHEGHAFVHTSPDGSTSLTVDTQTGEWLAQDGDIKESGDSLVALYASWHSLEFAEAAQRISDGLGLGARRTAQVIAMPNRSSGDGPGSGQRPPEPPQGPGGGGGGAAQPDAGIGQFRVLGHDRGRFYFRGHAGGQVRHFTSRELQSIGPLVELAPLTYWEREFPTQKGPDIRKAGAALVMECHEVGIYDPARVRGRGAWLEAGDSILHLGDRLLVNGVDTELDARPGKAIYERAQTLELDVTAKPLHTTEAKRLLELCTVLPFDDPASMGRLLAGWCVIAPVCGAMPWRPHLWITGEPGSGKSWIWDNIVRPMLGPLALRVSSKTTEAFLRQRLGSDAFPVLFDEAESQNNRDRERLQHVLDLARQASSEDTAEIGKGNQDGSPRTFRIRSCFAFASVNLGLSQAADESRTVTLTVRLNDNAEEKARAYRKLRDLHAEIMQPGFAAAMLARTIELLPVIRNNAEIFADAISRVSTRRAGDTVGVLLAGAWSLHSSKIATAEEAAAFVAGQQWVKDTLERAEVVPEWSQAVTFLVQQRLRMIPDNGPPEDTPVGELMACVTGGADADAFTGSGGACISRSKAEKALLDSGIKMELGYTQPGEWTVTLCFASEQIRRWFEKTQWAAAWATTISRAPGAFKDNKPRRFGSIGVKKGVSIPYAVFTG